MSTTFKELDSLLRSLGFSDVREGDENGSYRCGYICGDEAVMIEIGDPGSVLSLEEDSCPKCDEVVYYDEDGELMFPCSCGWDGEDSDEDEDDDEDYDEDEDY